MANEAKDGNQPVQPAPAAGDAGAPAAAPSPAPAAEPAAAPAAAAPAAETKTDSPPSLLGTADAGKREGAPAAPAADAKPSDAAPATPADPASAAKPADGTPPPDGAKDAPKPDAAKAAEPGKEGEPKAPDAAAKEALAEPPPAPVYGDLKLPEGFKLEGAKLKEFDTVLGKFETGSKVEHGQVEALRQDLVNFYHQEVQRIGQDVARHQIDVWNRMREGWINEMKADPELGGNRFETVLGNAKYAYQNYLGLDKTQQDTLMAILDNAGVSSHPLLVRGLNNLYKRFGEPEPVNPNLPFTQPKGKEPGNRGWYSAIDNVNRP